MVFVSVLGARTDFCCDYHQEDHNTLPDFLGRIPTKQDSIAALKRVYVCSVYIHMYVYKYMFLDLPTTRHHGPNPKMTAISATLMASWEIQVNPISPRPYTKPATSQTNTEPDKQGTSQTTATWGSELGEVPRRPTNPKNMAI